MKCCCFYPTATINLLLIKQANTRKLHPYPCLYKQRGRAAWGIGPVAFPGWGGFHSWRLPKKLPTALEGGLMHVICWNHQAPLPCLGNYWFLSLYDLTCVTVLCMLACRKCCPQIHSWRILFYLWLLSHVWLITSKNPHNGRKKTQMDPLPLPCHLASTPLQPKCFYSSQGRRNVSL